MRATRALRDRRVIGKAMRVPSVYAAGYEKARLIDPVLADSYVALTRVGDPPVDAVMADLEPLGHKQAARLLGAAIEQDEAVLREAPASLQHLIHEMTTVPVWHDREAAQCGCRAFFRNSEDILAAYLAGAIVEGFATMISKSFAITGRVIDNGARRLKQNIRHLLNIFMPRGVEPSADGWKLSLRNRMVHARVRALFRNSEEWNHDAWGVPLCGAHMALASAAFSARMINYAARLGASFDEDERAGIMAVWQYTAYVMGVPESVLFRTQTDGLRLFQVGTACEPFPDSDAVEMAHGLISSAPMVVGVCEPRERKKMADYIFRVSRELLGDATAEALHFPPRGTFAVLPWRRTKARLNRSIDRVFPARAKARAATSLLNLLDTADLGDRTFSYDLPDHVRSAQSTRW